MQIQSKMLEKMSFKLDGLEKEVEQLKKDRKQGSDNSELSDPYTYPTLPLIQKVADFDTTEKRQQWWQTLEPQWHHAFNIAILQKPKNHLPTDKELTYILTAPVARFVGPKGMHPSIDFELTNLSGIRHLTDLTTLVVSHNALTDLKGIEHLTKLEYLFVNSNKLTNLQPIHYLPQLKTLYCNVNQIADIYPLKNLTNLETLYCCYNQLQTLQGIMPQHVNQLKELVCLPNDKLADKEIMRIEQMGIICKKG